MSKKNKTKTLPQKSSLPLLSLSALNHVASRKQLWNWLLTKLKEFWYVPLAVTLIFIPIYFFIFLNLPSPAKLKSPVFPVSTQILDRNGKLLFEIYADQNRTPVRIDDLPPYVLEATIAIEDKNFYRHHGLAPEGIIRALTNIILHRKLQGGSTITQQLVKTALLTPERTIQRKIREAILSLATEIVYSKKQILEMYLNFTPYGGTAYGIETASKLYFDKSAKDLTLPEAALLAGLPQAPSRYSPFGASPENARARQKEVLRRMEEDKYISEDERQAAETASLAYAANKINIQAPHFVLYVKDLLVEKYGLRKIEQGGLRVTTSLDLDLQNYAQATVSAEVKKLSSLRVGNGAALITNPRTGEILAMVGSRDYFDIEHDGNVNLTIRPRQPGSSIKPINYAGVLGKGYNPASMVLDIPTCFQVTGQPLYCPKNYDNSFHGPVQLRYALANSYNIPAVKFLALNTIEDMIATASAMGITGWDDSSKYGLSLTLGGGEVTMADMAVAFGTFANSGIKIPLQPILKIEDYQGKILEEYKPPSDLVTIEKCKGKSECNDWSVTGTQVIPAEVAYLISNILQDNDARTAAFGPSSELVIPHQVVSVKTGTTNDLRDNWTIGYTPEFLVTTWVGNNDNTPMSYVASGVTGASPIWHKLMANVLKDHPATWSPKPENIVSLQVCTISGLLPNPEAPCSTRPELFIKGQEPKDIDTPSRGIWIDKNTNLPAFTGEVPPTDVDTSNLELRNFVILSDPFTKDFCYTCPWPQETNEDGTPKEGGSIAYPQQTIDMTKFFSSPVPFQLPTLAPTP